jgi:hypothetical protein
MKHTMTKLEDKNRPISFSIMSWVINFFRLTMDVTRQRHLKYHQNYNLNSTREPIIMLVQY